MRQARHARQDLKETRVRDELTAEFSMEVIGGRTLRVARWRWGQPSKHLPLLFFNGIGVNIEAIAPLAEALDERPFIVFDMPGIGGSPEPLIPYNTVVISWIAKELLKRLGCEQADVMGVSWGGAMAQQFALQHGNCVRRLVLAATSAGTFMIPGNPAALSVLPNPRFAFDAEFVNDQFRALYGELTGGDTEHVRRLVSPSPRGYLYQLFAMLGWTSAPALPFLSSQTLIMMGDEDAIMPLANGRILESLIPNSRLEILERAGHIFMLTHREQTLAAVRSFLDAPDQPARRAA
jgi:pimeloyl-ACP methyl ester carboxylesterase